MWSKNFLFIYEIRYCLDSQVRSIDPFIMTYMDEYAMLLNSKSDPSKLNKLVHDLLNIDPARAEAFVALSLLWERKDERRALAYAEKVILQSFEWVLPILILSKWCTESILFEQSIRIDDRHILGHITKVAWQGFLAAIYLLNGVIFFNTFRTHNLQYMFREDFFCHWTDLIQLWQPSGLLKSCGQIFAHIKVLWNHYLHFITMIWKIFFLFLIYKVFRLSSLLLGAI